MLVGLLSVAVAVPGERSLITVSPLCVGDVAKAAEGSLSYVDDLVQIRSLVWKPGGLPIGGLFSKSSASIVLGSAEASWCSSPARRVAAGFPADTWADGALSRGYVDDTLMIRPRPCPGCGANAFGEVY